jgi:hypothetical protein
MKKQTPILIAIAVVLCGLSFFGGIQYSASQNASKRAQFSGQFEGDMSGGQRVVGMRTGNRGGDANMVSGQVLSVDTQSITVKDRTGGSKIVFLGSSTEVLKSVTGTPADLVVGANVISNGTPNADGSITATTIQLRPEEQTFGGPNGAPNGQ